MGTMYNLKHGVGDSTKKEISFDHALSTAKTKYIIVPYDCKLVACYSCIDAGLSTADETIKFHNNAGTLMTGGTITIAESGAAAGDIDTCTPTASNSFTAGQKMKVIIGGESTSGGNAFITCVFELKV